MSEENNRKRVIAAQIIWDLWKAKDVEQLTLLKMQCDRSLQDIEQRQPTPNPQEP